MHQILRAITKSSAAALVIIIVIVIGVGGFALYSATRPESASSSNVTISDQLIISLAQRHWAAIGEKNLSLVMSQYSTGYEAVWFYIDNDSIGPPNGRYDCNIPRGPDNCSYFPSSAWQTLFNHTGSLNYTICNLNVTSELQGRESVQAIVWYYLTDRNVTLRVPFEMDFQYYNGTLAVWKDWFGLQQDPAIAFQGLINVPKCNTESVSSTT